MDHPIDPFGLAHGSSSYAIGAHAARAIDNRVSAPQPTAKTKINPHRQRLRGALLALLAIEFEADLDLDKEREFSQLFPSNPHFPSI
jgi:hypothetical protein